MNKRLEKKQIRPKERSHLVTPESQLPHAKWTPIAAVVLTSLISIGAYALCSHIPVVDYCTVTAWQIFG